MSSVNNNPISSISIPQPTGIEKVDAQQAMEALAKNAASIPALSRSSEAPATAAQTAKIA